MKPEDINPRNFKVKEIIYKDEDFAIAYGMWENKADVLAMRWNGYGDNDPGYPKTFGNPVWFIIPEILTVPITKALLDSKGANYIAILDILKQQLQTDQETTTLK